jgi:hypothetical protein
MSRKLKMLICQINIQEWKNVAKGEDVINENTGQTYAFVDEFLEQSMKISSLYEADEDVDHEYWSSKYIVSNRSINPTVTVGQISMTVKNTEFLIPTMLRSEQSPRKIILQMSCGFLIVELVVITANTQKG